VAFPISGAKQNTQTKIVVGHPDRPVLEIFFPLGPTNFKKSAIVVWVG
jgi:hypothetical protein